MFSIHQVRNFYVANAVGADNAAPATLGELTVCGVAGKSLYFKQKGHGGVVASDKINPANILYAKKTVAANLNTKLNSVNAKIVTVAVGQTYIINVHLQNYIGGGAGDTAVRLGAYTAVTGDTAAIIADKLGKSLELNTKRENLIKVTVTTDTINIAEVEQPWQRGKFPVAVMPVMVSVAPILSNGVETTAWATITKGVSTTASDASKKIADLEYFCMGTRGDEYRGMGYPNNFDTQYLTDLNATYDVVTIHYFDEGECMDSGKSEKDIQIAVPTAKTTVFIASINTMTGAAAGSPAHLD